MRNWIDCMMVKLSNVSNSGSINPIRTKSHCMVGIGKRTLQRSVNDVRPYNYDFSLYENFNI